MKDCKVKLTPDEKAEKLKKINQDFPRRNGWYYDVGKSGKEVYPSVTTIIGIIAKPALITWGARQAATVALNDPSLDINEVVSLAFSRKKEKGDIGTTVHSITKAIAEGTFDTKTIDNIDEELRGYVKGYIDWYMTYKPRILYAETKIWSDELGLAGTLDAIWDINGEIYLTDTKTSKNIYKEVKIQLSAYAICAIEMKLIPKIDKCAVLLLKPDGTKNFLEVNPAPLSVVMATKELWSWSNKEEA